VKLPPVWGSKSTTPVKAKTSGLRPATPVQTPPGLGPALTRRGLEPVTHTGSRERGGGLRQTVERQDLQRERRTVGRKDATGTAWATPLAHRLPALAKDFAALSMPNGACWKREAWTQAIHCRGA
jgi:hypothetical protein